MANFVHVFFARNRLSFERWLVPILAVLTALMGTVNLLSATFPSLPDRIAALEQYFPLEVRQGSHLTSVLAGFALLVLSVNLGRRKRMAWGLTSVILILSIFSHLLKGLDYEEASLAGGLLVLLWLARSQFTALSDIPSIKQGITAISAALLFTLVYGTIGFYLLDRHFSVQFEIIPAIKQTITMFTSFYDPGLEPLTGFGRYFADSIYSVGFLTLSYGLFMLVRPVILRKPATLLERQHAQEIVESYGHTSLARLCLLDDKSYFFSPNGSVISFVEKERMAVALGDPIGPPDDVKATIESFQVFCKRNDWQPAFYQTLPDYLEIYHQSGFDILPFGQEAIVDVSAFTLEGGENKSVRTSINKLTRLGHFAKLLEPPILQFTFNELRSISNEWLMMMHGSEKRFFSGLV